MAAYIGDRDFAAECAKLFEHGRAWMDENLFNGEYYEHHIRPVKDISEIYPGLLVGMGARDLSSPDFQLGSGCLLDQLVGQYMAHITGLGYLLEPGNVQTTYRSIRKYNRKVGFYDHFNCMRSYVMGDESALMVASYPKGRLERPFPYFSEAWTGLEYTAAAGMIYEGQVEEGLEAVRDVRERYDGRKRSPFDEAECGHHYTRAMASWATVLALTGFHYSAVQARLSLAPAPGLHFWSTGFAWGTCDLRRDGAGWRAHLRVLGGHLSLRRFALEGIGEAELPAAQDLASDSSLEFVL
jgi:uncharacterized protein (DUF608 family)